MKNRIIAILFVLFIFTCGIVTVRNSVEYVEHPEKQVATEALVNEIPDSDKGFNKETFDYASNLVTANYAYRNKWINGNGLFQKMIGKTGDIEKGWYRLDNGQLMYALNKQPDSVLNQYAENVTELSDYAKKHKIKFLYVELPYKAEDSSAFPTGVTDYANANADRITKNLSKQNVNVLDLRNRINETGKSRSELFFQTDHHWKPQTAIWGAGEVSKELTQLDSNWKDIQELRNMDNYRTENYKNQFLGSLGKKIGSTYDGTDDFNLILPKFETEYDYVSIKGEKRKHQEGSFEDTLIYRKNLKKDYFTVNTYVTYGGGDHPMDIVTNKKAKNAKKILLLRDSFSCTLMPFLSLYTNQIVTMDLRYYKEESVYSYLEKHPDIDTVIVAYNPSAISEQQYTFDKVTHE